MKKIKLITSLSTLGVLGGAVAATASGCTWSGTGSSSGAKVKMTKAFWTTVAGAVYQSYTVGIPTTDEGAFVLVPEKCSFDNDNFTKELNEKGVFKIDAGETAQALGLEIDEETYEIPIISIIPTEAGTWDLKIKLTLNNTPAEYGKGGAGKVYEVTSSVNVKEGIPDLNMPVKPAGGDNTQWWPFENKAYTGIQGTMGIYVNDSGENDPRFDVNNFYPDGVNPSNPKFKVYIVNDIESWDVTETTDVTCFKQESATSTTNGLVSDVFWINFSKKFCSSLGNDGKLLYLTLTDGESGPVLADTLFGAYDAESFVEFISDTLTSGGENVLTRIGDTPLVVYSTYNKTDGTCTVKSDADINTKAGAQLLWTAQKWNSDKQTFEDFPGITATYAPDKSNGQSITTKGTLTLTFDKSLTPELSGSGGGGTSAIVAIVGSGYSNNLVVPFIFNFIVTADEL